MSEEYRKICALCNKGTLIKLMGDIICEHEGLVSPEHSCPKFELNYLRIQPKRAKKPDTSKFKEEDFSIE